MISAMGFKVTYAWRYCITCCVITTDVQTTGTWLTLKELEDPELARLASQLPSTVLKSRADSSAKKYLGAFQRWRYWASTHNLPVFPAKEQHIALYLQSIANRLESKSAAEEAVNAINWAHTLAGLESPVNATFVQATLQGIRRSCCKPVRKKKPVTVDMLADMVENMNSHPTLANMRITTLSLLAFAGFLRFDEVIHIRASDVTIAEGMAKLQIPRSKTDQLRQGSEVLIARTGMPTCPVGMLERYMAKVGLDTTSELFLFRGITRTSGGERLRGTGPLSYTTVREQFRGKMLELGYPVSGYGLHSLRAGGASAAAQAGVPDRLFRQHGRWRSETAKDGYIEDSVENHLTVSKSIGI